MELHQIQTAGITLRYNLWAGFIKEIASKILDHFEFNERTVS